MNKPQREEYNPYYQRYIDQVEPGEFFNLFDENTSNTIHFYQSVPLEVHNFKYASDKWTIKDVLMHVIDTDRGFSYRAIMCIRGDSKTPLLPMDENMFAANVDTTDRPMESLLEEFQLVRSSFRILLEHATEAQLSFIGNGDGFGVSARAMGYIMLGHSTHHNKVIAERYLK